jgi:hypothetical protein
MAAPSIDDFINDFIAKVQELRPGLAVKVGQKSRLIAEGGASMADRLVGYAARLAKATYLDGAEGDDLTAYADDRWGIQRDPAIQAYTSVTFARASFAGGAGTVAAGTVVATVRDANGVEQRFLTSTPAVFGGTDLTKTVGVVAETGGVAGNVGAGTITRILSGLFDASLTVTNAQQAVGGTPEETDPDLRERVRQFPATIRRGTLDAIEYGARNTPNAGVSRATAVEDATGLMTLYVTDIAGNSDDAMVALVTTEIEFWRAGGSAITVVGGVLASQDISVTLTVPVGTAIPPLVALVQAAIASAVAKLKINETLYPALIQTAAMSAAPDVIKNVTVNNPSGPRVPSPGQIIRPGLITVL